MSVHSNRLAATIITSTTQTTIYTAPTAKRTIVKRIVVRNLAAAAARCFFQLQNAGGTTLANWNVWATAVGAAGDTADFDTWIVMNAGEHLTAQWNQAAGGSIIVSGSELDV